MKIKQILAILLFFPPSFLFAQEMIVPATINVERAVEDRKDNRYIAKSGELISLPFVDDFSSDFFPGNEEGNPVLWEQRKASLNRGLGINPPTLGIVSFDGTDESGYPYDFQSGGTGPADTLTSCPINLNYDSGDGVGISFYYQPRGNSFFPPNSQNDSLILEFYAPELDTWYWAWSTLDLSDFENFSFVYLPIMDSRFLKEGFKFRFRNIAFLDGLFSVWNIDYVWLDENNINDDPIVNDVAFINGPISLLSDYSAMPLTHYASDPSQRMLENTAVRFRNLNDNPRTLEGNEIVISLESVNLDVIDNPNTPAIAALSTANYSYQLETNGDQFVFDTSLGDEELIFDVDIKLGTVDFSETATNNTFSFEQIFSTYYSYDDGSAESGYAAAGTGSRLAIRYNNFLSDSLCALRIYTMPISNDFEGTSFTIKVWEDNGGVPGEELASASRQVIYGLNTYQEIINYEFEEPVFIPSGTFFVGYQNSSQSSGVAVGLDRNTLGNDNGNLVFDTGGGWQTTALVAEASVMIHPIFSSDCSSIFVSTNDRDNIPGFKLYPNPAHHMVTLVTEDGGNLNVSIFDLSGRLISNQITSRVLDVSTLQYGMYLIRVTDSKGRGGTKKLVIER